MLVLYSLMWLEVIYQEIRLRFAMSNMGLFNITGDIIEIDRKSSI
jgi:hypothetical protein